jgi:hypothetical protein
MVDESLGAEDEADHEHTTKRLRTTPLIDLSKMQVDPLHLMMLGGVSTVPDSVIDVTMEPGSGAPEHAMDSEVLAVLVKHTCKLPGAQ